MARIIRDLGRQVTLSGDFHIWELDCGCDIRIDAGTVRGRSNTDFKALVSNAAAAHDCDVVVHHQQSRRRDTYMGALIRSDTPRLNLFGNARDWLIDWGLVPPSFPQPSVPPVAPEEAVRRAADRLMGLQITSAVVDEVGPVPELVGFKPPEPKPPEPPRSKDRFELIELD